MERKAISIAQACQSVGVSRRTIYNWMAAGKVEYVRTAGGAVRIFEDTLWRTPQAVGSLTYRDTEPASERTTLERA